MLGKLSLTAGVFLILVFTWVDDNSEEGIARQPCVVFGGAESKVAGRGVRRILSEQEWVDLWREHKGKAAKTKIRFFLRSTQSPTR